jgi:Beta-lactamase enzyme family
VFMRDRSSGSWKQIGGPAAALVGGGWDLYAVAPGAGDLWRYDGNAWIKVGGPGAQFVGICNAVYALNPARTKVYRFDRYSGAWTEIGGPAQSIVGGGSKVYAAAPSNSAIWEYSRYLSKWTKIGGPGSKWVGVGGTVYGLTPDKSAVYRYNGTPENWTKVGGPAENLIGGGSSLYATQPGTGDVWRYSGISDQWEKIGTPGTGFVAVGRSLYALTPNKQAVYEFNDDSTESKRLHDLLYNIYTQSDFGNRVVRGFLVKRMAGEVLAEHCSDVCFQPLSTLKLLPYLYTMIEVDKDNATMDGTSVSWIQPTTGTPSAISDATCLKASDPNTQAGSDKLKNALPTMMWESHNRTLDSILNKYGPPNITTRGQSLGLRQTEMYFGCAQPSGPQKPWANNVSTLVDLAHLFEGVENLSFVTNASSRKAFRDNMIKLDAAPGTSYTSPITGRTTGPLNNEFLRPIVQEEAGPTKQAIVDEFMKQLVLRGKGGGGGPSGDEVGGSDFLEVSLPFKTNGAITTKKVLVGWFVCQLRSVPISVQQPQDQALADFRKEIHRLPIRLALQTW